MAAMCSRTPPSIGEAFRKVRLLTTTPDSRAEELVGSKLKIGTIKKSCVSCSAAKRKCNGDGVQQCSRCKSRGEVCTYKPRKISKLRRPRPHEDSPMTAKSHQLVAACMELRRGCLQQAGERVTKRCRLSASMATGLVGMEENVLLNDFYECLGFLPFADHSTIREALINIWRGCKQDSARTRPTAISGNGIAEKDELAAAAPSICVFWCAVALGGLVQGRPLELVDAYGEYAKSALDRCPEEASFDVTRAWVSMAYLHAFRGEADLSAKYVSLASSFLRKPDVRGTLNRRSEGFGELVRFMEHAHFYMGEEVTADCLESFCSERINIQQVGPIISDGRMSSFVLQTFHLAEQAFYDVILSSALGDESADVDDLGEEKLNGESRPASSESDCHRMISIAGQSLTGNAEAAKAMHLAVDVAIPHFAQLEDAARRPRVRSGLGGFMMNGVLIAMKIAENDMSGAMEKMKLCNDVLLRYPGIHRLTMGVHMTHRALQTLAWCGAAEMYEELRASFNRANPAGAVVPPFEEWTGIASLCDHVFCRSVGNFHTQNVESVFESIRDKQLDIVDLGDLGSRCGARCVSPSPSNPESPDPSPPIAGGELPEMTTLDLSLPGNVLSTEAFQHSTTANRCSSDSESSSCSSAEGRAESTSESHGRCAIPDSGRLMSPKYGDELVQDQSNWPDWYNVDGGSVGGQCRELLFDGAGASMQCEDVVSAADWLDTTHALLASS